MPKIERVYTISEVVEMNILGYKATTIRSIVKKYPVITHGRKIAIPESVLMTIIQDMTRQPKETVESPKKAKPKPKGRPIPGVTDDGLHLLPRRSERRSTA